MGKRSLGTKEKTKRIAICAALSALGVVTLYLGSFISVLDMSMAVIASVFTVIAVIEYGKGAPWLVYAVTGILSLVLLPEKSPALLYICFMGFYPIIKEKLESKRKIVSWVFKEVIFNVTLAVMLLLSNLVFSPTAEEPWYWMLIFVILAEIVFPIYDLALTRVISFYIYKLRPRFKFR